MINTGVNPYIVDYQGRTEFDLRSLSHLKIPKMPKSVYFSICPDETYPVEIQEPWYYINGVFQGDFKEIIGKGGEGYVISGKWMGLKAAFKFVEIEDQKLLKTTTDRTKDLNKRLTQVNALKLIKGSCILVQFGHFR